MISNNNNNVQKQNFKNTKCNNLNLTTKIWRMIQLIFPINEIHKNKVQ